MAQKANSYALRLGINQSWNSYYFSLGKKQADLLKQDMLIRDFISSISRDVIQIRIERSSSGLFVFVSTTNVNYLVEKNNERLEKIVKRVQDIVDNKKINVKIHLIEIKKVFSNAQYVANLIASKIKARTPFRVALRTVISKVTAQKEVKGIKVKISGRLDGSEIAKTEKVNSGKVPLSTLVSIIDFAKSEAKATYGKIGISVWIYKGRQRGKKILTFRNEVGEYRNVNTEKNQI
ncbi:MAG: 30S ribosomal protein S3 [Mycoplasmataceae bacterium]|nr:MAG: 30S ribosomal protein S3 [Mycoplasmataceae bacterium]